MALSTLGTWSLSWRRLGVLLRQLPPESRFMRSIGDPSLAWTTAEHLLALACDLLAGANWQRASGGKQKPRKPQPIPRPGEKPNAGDGRERRHGQPRPIEEVRQILRG